MRIIEQSAVIEDWTKMDLARRVERAARLCYGRDKERNPRAFVKALVEKKHFSPLEFARIETFGSIHLPGSLHMRDLRRLSLSGGGQLAQLMATMVEEEYPEFFEDIQHKWTRPAHKKNALSWRHHDTWVPVLITTNRAVSHQLVRHRHEIAFMQASQRFIRYNDEIECIRPSVYFEPNTAAEDNWTDMMMESEHRYAHALELGHQAQAARLMLTNSTATRILVYASVGEWGYIFKLRCSEKADPMMRALMIPLRDEFLRRNIISQDYLDNVGRYW